MDMSVWYLVGAVLVFFMQGGFAMVETGFTRAKNAGNIIMKNLMDFCIGTGRMGLALTKEYQEQLKLVQEEIGFRHIRGHGLFCDDMAIYQEYEEGGVKKEEYNLSLIHI